jgi:hypothetical protein
MSASLEAGVAPIVAIRVVDADAHAQRPMVAATRLRRAKYGRGVRI